MKPLLILIGVLGLLAAVITGCIPSTQLVTLNSSISSGPCFE